MKKFLLLALLFCTVSIAHAQQKTAPKTSATTTVIPKDSLLMGMWKLSAVEEFAVKAPPAEKQKDDAATFMKDRTAFVTLNGQKITGTWELDKSQKWITVTEDGTAAKWKFKLMKVDAKEMIYEYQDADQIRTIFYFEPVKK